MEQENQYIVWPISSKTALHAVLSSCNDDISFDAGWSIVKGSFESLKSFVWQIVSVFLGTAQMESDFSIVKIEKEDFQISLTDLSLEGILHIKQYSMLALL